VLLDKIGPPPVGAKRLFVDGDGLEQHAAVWSQQAVARPEELVVVGQPHGLEHLDTDDLAVLAAKASIILLEQFNPIPAGHRVEPLACVLVLPLADPGGGHAAAIILHRVLGEAAPPCADFQYVVFRAQAQLPADAVQLLELGGFERIAF
jgi:hypothetical protein